MSPSVFLAADFRLLIECAWHRRNNVAAQHAEPFARFYQFFV
jgi:hypothetical protein